MASTLAISIQQFVMSGCECKPGAKRERDSAQPQDKGADRVVIFGSFSRRTTPSALSQEASQHSLDAQPPLLFEEGNTTVSK